MTTEMYWLFGGVGTCLAAGFAAYVSIVRKLAHIDGSVARMASDLESEKEVRAERNSDYESRLRTLEKAARIRK